MGVSSDGGFQNRGQGPEDEEILIDHLGPSDRVNFPLLHLSVCPSRKTVLIAKKSKASYSVPEPKAGVFLCLKERIAKLQNKDFYLCKGIKPS